VIRDATESRRASTALRTSQGFGIADPGSVIERRLESRDPQVGGGVGHLLFAGGSLL
jgi:hypothetical protein